MIRRDSAIPGKLWQRNIMTNYAWACFSVVQGRLRLPWWGLRIWKGWGCSSSRLGVFWAKHHSRRNIKKLHIFKSFYLLDSCNESLKWSPLGSKKGCTTPRLVSLRSLIQNFRRESPPLSKAESSPPPLDKALYLCMSSSVSTALNGFAWLAVKLSSSPVGILSDVGAEDCSCCPSGCHC